MLASIGRIPESVDDNYQQLHRYARESSNPRQLNKFIDLCNKQKDTHNITFEIDYRNNIGQTPLWVACFLLEKEDFASHILCRTSCKHV